jgi:hypothetical protein
MIVMPHNKSSNATCPNGQVAQLKEGSLLIERVDYDGEQGQVSITFHPTGLQTMLGDLAKEKCA